MHFDGSVGSGMIDLNAQIRSMAAKSSFDKTLLAGTSRLCKLLIFKLHTKSYFIYAPKLDTFAPHFSSGCLIIHET